MLFFTLNNVIDISALSFSFLELMLRSMSIVSLNIANLHRWVELISWETAVDEQKFRRDLQMSDVIYRYISSSESGFDCPKRTVFTQQ
ncbi:hypothetical protein H6G89_21180 [Oscillatoria sp. FACHB-1407]|uniref:hypothetical protein n=1 Tax=Oscillatoria sp. FACHB-1407 TaxID=2692847 RepID=UPI001983DC4C|nr:hypothetical protein [Oscillatoria sp. FACHB-1407]